MHSSLYVPSQPSSSFSALGSSARSASALSRALRSEEYSLRNRVRSLLDDRAFVAEARTYYPTMPVFANLRCGLWYVPECRAASTDAGEATAAASSGMQSASLLSATSPAEPCYFKSTDGHPHHWKFSEARLNVHVIQRIIQQQPPLQQGSAASIATAESTTPSAASPSPSRCSGASSSTTPS